MTNTPKSTDNYGTGSTVHSPKAPGEIEKVNPQTGGTTTESTHAGKNPTKR